MPLPPCRRDQHFPEKSLDIAPHRSHYFRVPKVSSNRTWRWSILGSLCLCLIGAIVLRSCNWIPRGSAAKLQWVAADVELDLPAFIRSIRPVYPYSVIPGGVYSSRELRDSIVRDPIVASHYVGFDIAHAALVRTTIPTLRYVSYRKNNQIIWTRKQLRIPKGELLISDGAHFARARCGNRLSSTLVGPAPDGGPDVELSIPDIQPSPSNFSLAANRIEPVGIRPVAELRLVDPAMDSWHPISENIYSQSESAFDPIYANAIVPTPITIGPGSATQGTPASPQNPLSPVPQASQPTIAPVPELSTLWQVTSTLAIALSILAVFRRSSRKTEDPALGADSQR